MILKIADIRTDGGTQPRAALDHDMIESFVEALEAGAKFPPVDVFFDGTTYWLGDGFHRVRATYAADRDEIECRVHQGTLQDAQWFSFGANKTNGLYRSNADKQRAIQSALQHPKSAGLSDVQIAKHVGVSRRAVDGWREKLSRQNAKIDQPTTRTAVRNGKTYQIKVDNIGKRPEPTLEVRHAVVPEPQPARPSTRPNPQSIAMLFTARCNLILAKSLWKDGDEEHLSVQGIKECYELLDFFDGKAAGSSVA